jgi:DNA-binding beta-propeller fold protein YncE
MSRSTLLCLILLAAAATNAHGDIVVGTYADRAVRVFDADADADTPPIRVIAGPSTGMETPSGFAFDTADRTLFVADFRGEAIQVFPAYAEGDVQPLRVLTWAGLGQPRAVALVPQHGELFVVSGSGVAAAYDKMAQGNTPPIRRLDWGGGSGSVTQLNNPTDIAYAAGSDEIVIPDLDRDAPYARKLLVFDRTASGNTAPHRVIKGDATRLGNLPAYVAIDAGLLYVTTASTNQDGTVSARVLVFDAAAEGDAAPLRVIEGPATGLHFAMNTWLRGITIDPQRRELVVPVLNNSAANPTMLFAFDIDANGDEAPARVIEGAATGLEGTIGSVLWIPSEHIFASGFE